MSGVINGTLFRFNKAKKNCGVMWLENAPMTLHNVTFLKNTANKGGAMYLRNYLSDADRIDPDFVPRTLYIDATSFIENVALDAGGAIEMSQVGCTIHTYRLLTREKGRGGWRGTVSHCVELFSALF